MHERCEREINLIKVARPKRFNQIETKILGKAKYEKLSLAALLMPTMEWNAWDWSHSADYNWISSTLLKSDSKLTKESYDKRRRRNFSNWYQLFNSIYISFDYNSPASLFPFSMTYFCHLDIHEPNECWRQKRNFERRRGLLCYSWDENWVWQFGSNWFTLGLREYFRRATQGEIIEIELCKLRAWTTWLNIP